MNGAKFVLALVTAPDLKTARQLARAALEARLVACANLVPGVESHYWWRDGLDRSSEVLLLLKTRSALVRPLENLIVGLHPYDTPEFIALELSAGNRRYLDWIAGSTAAASKPNRRADPRRARRAGGESS